MRRSKLSACRVRKINKNQAFTCDAMCTWHLMCIVRSHIRSYVCYSPKEMMLHICWNHTWEKHAMLSFLRLNSSHENMPPLTFYSYLFFSNAKLVPVTPLFICLTPFLAPYIKNKNSAELTFRKHNNMDYNMHVVRFGVVRLRDRDKSLTLWRARDLLVLYTFTFYIIIIYFFLSF